MDEHGGFLYCINYTIDALVLNQIVETVLVQKTDSVLPSDQKRGSSVIDVPRSRFTERGVAGKLGLLEV